MPASFLCCTVVGGDARVDVPHQVDEEVQEVVGLDLLVLEVVVDGPRAEVGGPVLE